MVFPEIMLILTEFISNEEAYFSKFANGITSVAFFPKDQQ